MRELIEPEYTKDVTDCSCGKKLWRAYAHRRPDKKDEKIDVLVEIWHCHDCYNTFTTENGDEINTKT